MQVIIIILFRFSFHNADVILCTYFKTSIRIYWWHFLFINRWRIGYFKMFHISAPHTIKYYTWRFPLLSILFSSLVTSSRQKTWRKFLLIFRRSFFSNFRNVIFCCISFTIMKLTTVMSTECTFYAKSATCKLLIQKWWKMSVVYN